MSRPGWLERLADSLPQVGAAVAEHLSDRTRAARAEGVDLGARSGRRAAVLVLFGPGADGSGDVVLLERAAGLRSHSGQIAFPGGGVEDADGGDPVRAALREAHEEVRLDPAGVEVLGVAPALVVPPTGTSVVPVLAWEPEPSPLGVGDPVEVARVLRVPLAVLTDPASRAVVRTRSGWTGPTFALGGPAGEDGRLVAWGFTAAVLDVLLRVAGLERPWDGSRALPLSAVTGGLPEAGR
ncbi:CoA pyrophosphatase [Streptomyces sp. NP160]|uniref:NUDIX hydrolase n=1 Tax=Streptomyces sp. NP160 TaxID=2586637 RepID=UPI0015D64004|nr:CoA pyrophosphatase [Streptomyces sp. NP160]